MAVKVKNHFVELSTGLYLNASGKIVDKLPTDEKYKILELPFKMNLPDFLKDELKGQDLNKTIQSLLNSGHLTDHLGISPKVLAILGASVNLLFSLTSITGAVGAWTDVLKLLIGSTSGQPDKVTQVLQIVGEIHDFMKDTARDAVVNKVIQEWKPIRVGETALRGYLLDNSPGLVAINDLTKRYHELVGATVTLLDPDFQCFPKESSDFANFPWYPNRSWLVARPGVSLPDSANINTMSQSKSLWDYTPYIGAITSAVSLLMLYYKTLDPAFRTTSTFQIDIKKIADSLQVFVNTMVEHLLWTRDWTINDYYFMPMAEGWPVGAVDVCSGTSVYNPGWKEGVQVASLQGAIGNSPNPAGVVKGEPPLVLNATESLHKARIEREKNWLVIFYASGAPKLLQLVDMLREMATVPETSETVKTNIRKTAKRNLVGSELRRTPHMPRCETLDFTASVYTVKRSVQINGTLQAPKRHPEAPFYWPIPYRFFIETYPGSIVAGKPLSRQELIPGNHTVELSAQVFDWEVEDDQVHFEVSPLIQDRLENLLQDKYVVLANARPDLQTAFYPWNKPLDRHPELADILIQDPDMPGTPRNASIRTMPFKYQFIRGDNDFRFVFQNEPGKDNTAGVYFVVEEQSRLLDDEGNQKRGPIIKTRIDISMIGRELHLPKKYFEYIRMCEARTRAIISQIEFEFRLKEKPIPRWDPLIHENIRTWAQQILRDQPDVLEGDLLKEAQTLAKRISVESA